MKTAYIVKYIAKSFADAYYISEEGGTLDGLWKKTMETVVGLYMFVAFAIFTPYFNWQYAKQNGFTKWLLLGEVVATAKAMSWPYFLSSINMTASRDWLPHFKRSIQYSNDATKILNKSEPNHTIAQEDINLVIDYYKKAIYEAKQADIVSMNRFHSGFGDHFQQEFIKGIELFLQSAEEVDPAKSIAAYTLKDQWGTWYDENIDKILNK